MALPQRGYCDDEFARAAKKVIVEIDPNELEKFEFEIDVPVLGNVKDFIDALSIEANESLEKPFSFDTWVASVATLAQKYPMAQAPEDPQSPVNSYWFIEQLSQHLSSDDIIVTDMGTSLTCTHATISLKNGQRLITSTGLGEMGFRLQRHWCGSWGAPERRVILICGEGSRS